MPLGRFQHRGYLRTGHGDVGVIHRLRRVGQRFVGGQSVDFRGAWMNWINLAGVAELADAANEMIG
ncbi:hypothetical protein D3C83_242100 [compost metagenome]